MIYEPNTRFWQVGDVVIHDHDAKAPYMLMVVIRYRPDGLIVTRYLDADHPVHRGRRTKLHENSPQFLHDPARFGLAIPAPVPVGVAPSPSAGTSTLQPSPIDAEETRP